MAHFLLRFSTPGVFGGTSLMLHMVVLHQPDHDKTTAEGVLPSIDVSLSILSLVIWQLDLGICQIISRL